MKGACSTVCRKVYTVHTDGNDRHAQVVARTPSCSNQHILNVCVLKNTIPYRVTSPFCTGSFQGHKEQGQKGRPDDVPCVLARSIRSNLQYQAAAGIGERGAENMAVRGKCMERAM